MVPQLTQHQMLWLHGELSKYQNLVYVGFYGSHVYNLERPESDIDIKAVYVPSLQDLILGKANKTHQHKNDELNIEIEVKSIQSFLSSAAYCDTNVVDMLHTPKEYWVYQSKLWEHLVNLRHTLYSKSMSGLIGYIKTHSHKYSNKIERYTEMKELLEVIYCFDKPAEQFTIKQLCNTLDFDFFIHKAKYTKPVELVEKGVQQYLEVCGKKYIYTWTAQQLADALEKEVARYGKRTEGGSVVGLDCKSLSHALRVLTQLHQILTTGEVTFPLPNTQFIKDVKTGEELDLDFILKYLDIKFDECMELLGQSNLPQKTDVTKMVNCVEDYYKQLLTKGEEIK